MTIPLSGDTCAAEQSISAGPPPRTPVSSAMMAKVGDAARASPSAAQSAPAFRRVACPSESAGTGLAHGFVLACWFRNAASPASDTSTHFLSGAASAT